MHPSACPTYTFQVSTSPTGTPNLQTQTLPVVHEMQAISLRASTTNEVQFVDLLTPVQHEIQHIQTSVTPIPEVQSFFTVQNTVVNEIQVRASARVRCSTMLLVLFFVLIHCGSDPSPMIFIVFNDLPSLHTHSLTLGSDSLDRDHHLDGH